eukprot:6178361-Pleurochrysis_carterae.AAC.3
MRTAHASTHEHSKAPAPMRCTRPPSSGNMREHLCDAREPAAELSQACTPAAVRCKYASGRRRTNVRTCVDGTAGMRMHAHEQDDGVLTMKMARTSLACADALACASSQRVQVCERTSAGLRHTPASLRARACAHMRARMHMDARKHVNLLFRALRRTPVRTWAHACGPAPARTRLLAGAHLRYQCVCAPVPAATACAQRLAHSVPECARLRAHRCKHAHMGPRSGAGKRTGARAPG